MPNNAKNRLTSIVISVIVFLIGIGLSFAKPIKDIPIHIVVYIAAYFIVGVKPILAAVNNVKQAKLLEANFLITALSIFALYMGEYVGAIFLITLYSLSELFKELSKVREKDLGCEKTHTLIAATLSIAVAIIPAILGCSFSVWFHNGLWLFFIICPLALAIINAVKLIRQ